MKPITFKGTIEEIDAYLKGVRDCQKRINILRQLELKQKMKKTNKENEKGRRPDFSNKADNIAVWISKTKTGNDYLYVKIGDDVFRAWKND